MTTPKTIEAGTIVNLKSDSLNRGSLTCEGGDWGWIGSNVGNRNVGDIVETTMEENNGPGWKNRVTICVTKKIDLIGKDASGYEWEGEILSAAAV